MEFDLPELLRGFERLAAVLIGGFTIYLGYRLFSKVPKDKDAAGTVTFPGGIKVNLSHVGPGAFFALFGGILIGIALLSPIHRHVTTSNTNDSREIDDSNSQEVVSYEVFSVDGNALTLP